MAVVFDVYDVTNTTKLGTLAKGHSIGWVADLRVPGALVLSVDVAAAADRALLQKLRVIRVRIDGTDREAYVIQDDPKELVADIPVVMYQCRHLLSWLGYGTGGAVLWPYGGLDGLQQSPRWFGPMGFDFPTVVAPEPTTGGPLTRENWQDPLAERFVFTARAVYRRVLAATPLREGPARMWLTSASWTEVRVWFDGAEVPALSTPIGDRSIRMLDVPYDGEEHVICFDCLGSPPAGLSNSLGWTWANLYADDLGEYNDWGQMEGRLFTTFNSATYTGPTAPSPPLWQAWEDYADGGYPGVTVGRVAATGVDEAQVRGLLPTVTYDFDETVDSGSVAWEYEFARSFRPQRLGHLLESLAGFGCEPEMTPAGVLRLHQQRGTDRTATVTISTRSFSLALTGRGHQATRYLTETDGGFGEVVNATVETALGTAMEDYVSLGEDLHPHTIDEAILLQLDEDSSAYDEFEVDLPDDVVPHVDVFLGDLVQCRSDADGALAPARITSLRAQVQRDNSRIQWSAILEPA